MKKEGTVVSVLSRVIKLIIAVLIIILLYAAGVNSYDFGYRIFSEKPVSMAPGKDVNVIIKDGMGTTEVAQMLEKRGVIRDAVIFMIQNRFSHYNGSFQAGTYTLNTSMENEEIMAILSGEVGQE